MRNNKNLKIILLALILTTIFMATPVQADDPYVIHGIDIYRWHVRNAVNTGLDYDPESHILKARVIPRPRAETPENYGLALVAFLFNISSVPNNFRAYMIIDNETVDVIDQLVNYTIVQDLTYTKNEGSDEEREVPATYFEAFIYLFENHSVVDEEPMPRPSFGPWANTVPPLGALSVQADPTVRPVIVDLIYGEEPVIPVELDYFLIGVAVVSLTALVLTAWLLKRYLNNSV